MTAPKLTKAQQIVLQRCVDHGAAIAGHQDNGRGSLLIISASTLTALFRRDLVTLHVSPDGNVMARITDAGRAALKEGGK